MAASDFSAALRQVLSATVSDLHRPTEPQHVVVLKDTATVEQTLRALASHSILSAPVVSVKPGAESPQGHSPLWPADAPAEQILGFVDVRDLMESFLKGNWLQSQAGCMESRDVGCDGGMVHSICSLMHDLPNSLLTPPAMPSFVLQKWTCPRCCRPTC